MKLSFLKYWCLILIMMIVFVVSSCKSAKTIPVNQLTGSELVNHNSSDRAIIYKTKGDFSNNIPVIMNDERTKIIRFPARDALNYDGKITRPVKLIKGYLLDNNSINANVAFLSFTYEQYFNFREMPSEELMMKYILEKYPLVEMYDCGIRSEYRDLIHEINVLIDRDLKNCKKIDVQTEVK